MCNFYFIFPKKKTGNWGLKLAPDTLNIMGRQLDPEILFFGKGYKERVNDKADWGRAATSKNVLTAVPLNKWAIVYVDKNDAIVRSFCKCLTQQGPRLVCICFHAAAAGLCFLMNF